MTIFGHHFKHQTVWIGGGLIAAAIAVVVWLRARAAAAPAAGETAADPGGYGMSVGAPTQGVADQYQQQLNQGEVEAQNIANAYQGELLRQSKAQFDFQQAQMEAVAPAYQNELKAELGAQEHYYKTVANTKISCPGGYGVAQDTSGQLYCRQKTSGIPIVTDLLRTARGLVYGAEAAAPSIGYEAAQNAAAYYTGKYFAPQKGVVVGKGSTPPIAPQRRTAGNTQQASVIWGCFTDDCLHSKIRNEV
jgi:hypothetical protein